MMRVSSRLVSKCRAESRREEQERLKRRKVETHRVIGKYLRENDRTGYKKYVDNVDATLICAILLLSADLVYRVYFEFDQKQLDENYAELT